MRTRHTPGKNRFLQEVVEYHQFTMQDVVYSDENIEEVTDHLNSFRFSPLLQTRKPGISNDTIIVLFYSSCNSDNLFNRGTREPLRCSDMTSLVEPMSLPLMKTAGTGVEHPILIRAFSISRQSGSLSISWIVG
ncbi:PREDICTED: uncharacterized protein LOC104801537 [Tarenaya hassleriana]|uniref:uncharacterized protein LOC104801537 n=1 Tax=Tarenaya hassleriana TaxID=28532 RepID=UPI0008FD112F|nr:PREDICTED: uncharacterized protein LOC104801537 [Tarenaya hassleriana]